MAASFSAVFRNGDVEIGTLIKDFDWSKINVKDSKSNDYLNIDLAPSLGTLNKESIRKINDDLKIMIAGNMKALSRLQDRGWDAVLGSMMHDPLLRAHENEVARRDKLTKENSNPFKTDGSPDASIVREVKTWFTDLVEDQNVVNSTKIDNQVLAKIVAQIGTVIDSFETFGNKNENHEQTIMDICVLCFPDIDHPFFQLYRIKLNAWSDRSRKNGIAGEFNSRIFFPSKSVIDVLPDRVRDGAISSLDAMWN